MDVYESVRYNRFLLGDSLVMDNQSLFPSSMNTNLKNKCISAVFGK